MTGQADQAGSPPARPIVRAAAVATILMGGVVLLGWGLGVESLKDPFPGQVSTKTNAAVCLVLGGLALLRPRRSAIACASLAAAVGGLTLVEHALHVNFGIDQLLFRELPGAIGTVHPNRMSPNAALGLVLLGLALGVNAARRAVPAAQSLALAAAAIAMAALVGCAFGVQPIIGVAGHTLFSPIAALAMLVLAAGVLLARPDRGVMACLTGDLAGGLMARRLLPVALLPILAGIVCQLGRQAGLFDVSFQAALDALVGSYLLLGFIWWNAASLDRVERERGGWRRPSTAASEDCRSSSNTPLLSSSSRTPRAAISS